MANLTALQWVVDLSMVVPRKIPLSMKQNQRWRAGMGVGLWERIFLTPSQMGRPAKWKVRKPLTWLALHCRAQAGNRKKNTTPAKTGVLRVGRSGLLGKVILSFRALVTRSCWLIFMVIYLSGSLSPTPFVCRSLQIVGVEVT